MEYEMVKPTKMGQLRLSSTLELSLSEQERLDEQLHFDRVKISVFDVYHYASKFDVVIAAISAIAALLAGALVPLSPVRT
jgi:hypothetical protein